MVLAKHSIVAKRLVNEEKKIFIQFCARHNVYETIKNADFLC